MVHTLTVKDLTPEDYKKFTENYFEVMSDILKADKNVKAELKVLETLNGRAVIHQRMDPGIVFVSARSIIVQ